MSGRCWSRPAGECRDRPPARTVRGAGSARSVVAARDAGASPFAAAVAGLGRIERTLRQRRQHRFRARTAALCRHRRRDPGGARGHAGRCRARALHRPGRSLGEPQVRRRGGCLGRAARRRRRSNGAHGATPGCAAGPWRLAQAARGRSALHPFRLPGVRHGLPRGGAGTGSGDGARRVPPGIGRHARLGRRPCAAPGAGRAALARGRAGCARHAGRTRRGSRSPGPALVTARSDPRTVYRARPRAHRGADRPHLPSPRQRRHCGAGALGHRLPRGLAGLARQRADRRFPPRLPAARRAGADLSHRGHQRRGGGREGLPQIRPRHPAGRNRHCKVSPRLAGEGPRLAERHRADQGRREAGPGLLHGRGLCAARCARRSRAGGARDLSRPGLAGERRALCAIAVLAGVSADGVCRRARRRSRTHGPHEDAADLVGGQPGAGPRRMARPAVPSGYTAGAAADRAKRAAGLLVAVCQRGRQLQTSRSPASRAPASRC